MEDPVSAVLAFKSGAIGMLQATIAIHSGYPRRLSISGTKGTVTLSDENFLEWDIEGYEKPAHIVLGSPDNAGASDPMSIGTQGHQAHIEDMVDAITNDHSPLVDAREGRRALEIIRAVYESSQKGIRIDL